MKTINSVCNILFLLFSIHAFSAELLVGRPVFPVSPQMTSEFHAEVVAAQQACADLSCAQSSITVRALTRHDLQAMDDSTVAKLATSAQNIAELEWPDTILEGPYVADFKVGLQEVDELYKQNSLIGYRIVYEDRGWKTDGCHYNPKVPSSLGICTPGRFVETAFVDAELKEYFRDPQSMVEFQPDNADE